MGRNEFEGGEGVKVAAGGKCIFSLSCLLVLALHYIIMLGVVQFLLLLLVVAVQADSYCGDHNCYQLLGVIEDAD
jgi:hypothetical protein